MDSFPETFVATKVNIDVAMNRGKKIEHDIKILRKKIYSSFQGVTDFYVPISHEFQCDCSPEEKKNCYTQIKDELEERGFVVKGNIVGNTIHLLIASNQPRSNDSRWNEIMKQFVERPSSISTRSVLDPSTISHALSKMKRKKKKQTLQENEDFSCSEDDDKDNRVEHGTLCRVEHGHLDEKEKEEHESLPPERFHVVDCPPVEPPVEPPPLSNLFSGYALSTNLPSISSGHQSPINDTKSLETTIPEPFHTSPTSPKSLPLQKNPQPFQTKHSPRSLNVERKLSHIQERSLSHPANTHLNSKRSSKSNEDVQSEEIDWNVIKNALKKTKKRHSNNK